MFAGEPVVVAKYVSERAQAERRKDVARSLRWTLLRENWSVFASRLNMYSNSTVWGFRVVTEHTFVTTFTL